MKDIFGYEGLYAITKDGKVWSYRSNKFLRPGKNSIGYYTVVLCKENKNKTHYLHRLVAQTYLDNPENLPQVNHKDENKSNNNVSNLEWCTQRYNNKYGSRTKRTMRSIYCVELNKTYSGIRAAARELGVNPSNISNCLIGHSKTTGGYHWKYV